LTFDSPCSPTCGRDIHLLRINSQQRRRRRLLPICPRSAACSTQLRSAISSSKEILLPVSAEIPVSQSSCTRSLAQMLDRDVRAWNHEHQRCISFPVRARCPASVVLQHFQRLQVNGFQRQTVPAQYNAEMIDQQRDVAFPFAQRRKNNRITLMR